MFDRYTLFTVVPGEIGFLSEKPGTVLYFLDRKSLEMSWISGQVQSVSSGQVKSVSCLNPVYKRSYSSRMET